MVPLLRRVPPLLGCLPVWTLVLAPLFFFPLPFLGAFFLWSLTRFHHFDEISPTKERVVLRIQRSDVTIVQSVQKHEHDRICHFVGINCGPGFFSGTALRSSARYTSVFCPQLSFPSPLVLFAWQTVTKCGGWFQGVYKVWELAKRWGCLGFLKLNKLVKWAIWAKNVW